jgi:WhiB family transcriptional regulator, redox-sensing transcriptional regulator
MNGSLSASEPDPTREYDERAAGGLRGTSTGSDEWRSRSACRAEDPELFFPAARSLTVFVQLARAKAVCGRCPVAWECLRYALATGQQHGVWGGKSEEERKALRRRLPVGSPALPLEQAG